MMGNSRKQWGIIYTPYVKHSNYEERWCKDDYGKPELHYTKKEAEKSRVNYWGTTSYKTEKIVKRKMI